MFEGLFRSLIRGNNYGITRATWEQLGPPPADMHPVEDLAFAFCAYRASIDVVPVPEAVVHYRYRTDAGSLWRQGFAYGRVGPARRPSGIHHGRRVPTAALLRLAVVVLVGSQRVAAGSSCRPPPLGVGGRQSAWPAGRQRREPGDLSVSTGVVLSVVIPVRNGAANLGAQLDRAGESRAAAGRLRDRGRGQWLDRLHRGRGRGVSRAIADTGGRRIERPGYQRRSQRRCRGFGGTVDPAVRCRRRGRRGVAGRDRAQRSNRVPSWWAGPSTIGGSIHPRCGPGVAPITDESKRRLGSWPRHTVRTADSHVRFTKRSAGSTRRIATSGEDTEFFWRAQLAGNELVVVDDAVVHYGLRSDLRGVWHQFRSYGRSQPQLYRDFRNVGMPRRTVRQVIRTLCWLLSRAPFAIPRSRRGAWVRVLAQQLGRVRGSVTWRVLYLDLRWGGVIAPPGPGSHGVYVDRHRVWQIARSV